MYLFLGVAAAAAGGAAAAGAGLHLGGGGDLRGGSAVKARTAEAVPGRRRWQRRRGCRRGRWGLRHSGRSCDVREARPKRRSPLGRSRIIHAGGHGGRRSEKLLGLSAAVFFTPVLLGLNLRHLDLLPSLSDRRAHVSGLCGRSGPRHLPRVLRGRKRVPVFGLSEISHLRVVVPEISPDRWEREKRLRVSGIEAVKGRLVEEQARILEHAMRKLQAFMSRRWSVRGHGPGELVCPVTAVFWRTLWAIRHPPKSNNPTTTKKNVPGELLLSSSVKQAHANNTRWKIKEMPSQFALLWIMFRDASVVEVGSRGVLDWVKMWAALV